MAYLAQGNVCGMWRLHEWKRVQDEKRRGQGCSEYAPVVAAGEGRRQKARHVSGSCCAWQRFLELIGEIQTWDKEAGGLSAACHQHLQPSVTKPLRSAQVDPLWCWRQKMRIIDCQYRRPDSLDLYALGSHQSKRSDRLKDGRSIWGPSTVEMPQNLWTGALSV